MIENVLIEPLKVIADERGAVMHMMRADADFFKSFGEIYFSLIQPEVIKGWKTHTKQTQHFAVPEGNIKLVLYDARLESSTYKEIQEIYLGVDDYKLVRIPYGVTYAFQALNNQKALVANCADVPHSPEESKVLDLNDACIPYQWDC